MDSFRSLYHQHGFELWLLLLVLIVVALFWMFYLHASHRRLESRLESIFNAAGDENTARMLADYLGIVRNTAASVNRIKAEHDQIAALMPSVIRHIGLVRFSPFHDTGGDQSFTLALLNGDRDGIVVTALHSRTESRLYAKPIEQTRSQYSLTPEEREAIDRALHRSPVEASS